MTALADADCEDRVIAALIQEDFTLIQRCHSITHLQDFLTSRIEEKRLIIITDEEFGLSAREYSVLASEQRALLQLSARDSLEPESIKCRVHEALRSPEVLTPQIRRREKRGDFVAFTGSSGSPGISTVALNVAAELSEERKVQLIDADPSRRDLHQRLGMQSSENIQLTTQFLVRNIESFDFTFSNVQKNGCINLLDIGDAPSLNGLLTDRRRVAREYFEILEQSTHIVFVAQPESSSISELENFQLLIDQIISGASITYVLNKSGPSNRQRALHKSFRARIGIDRTFCLPREYSVLDRTQSQYSTLMEVAPRSGLRRAMRELSIYLDKSI